MPTTSAGVAYTAFSASVPDAGTVGWAVADDVAATANIPTILYAHGSGGAWNQFQTLSAWAGMREWLINNGWAWIECTGGGDKSWGNRAAQIAYETAFSYVAGILDIGGVVVLGRSMGGVVGEWLFIKSTVVAPLCIGAIENSGVQSLSAWYEAGIDQSAVLAAFGATDAASFAAATSSFEPLGWDPSEWDGKNIIQLVGSADTTVPPADHGLAMRTHYAGHPAIDLLDTREGGDHSSANGSYLEVDAMSNFLLQITGETPVPPPAGHLYRSRARYLMGAAGTRYVLHPRA